MRMSVCLSVCSHNSKTTQPNFANFCTLLVAVTRSSSDGVAVRYIFPVLWMTSYFLTMGQSPMGENRARRYVFRISSPGGGISWTSDSYSVWSSWSQWVHHRSRSLSPTIDFVVVVVVVSEAMLLLLLATLNVLLMMTMHTNALPVTDRHNGQRKHSRFHTQTIRQHTHSTVVILVPSLCFKKCHSLAASLSVNASGCWNRVVAYSPSDSICRTVCLTVGRSVGLSGVLLVEKRLIGFGYRLGWWVASVEGWVY